MNKLAIVLIIVIISVIAGLVYLNHPTPQAINPLDAINSTPTPPLNLFTTVVPTNATSTAILTTTDSKQSNELNTKATSAAILTTKGEIDLKLFPLDAPKTVTNFVQKASSNYYKNLIFHRVEDWVLQGGDPKGNGTGGGSMPVEFNSKPFIVGSLGVASLGDGKTQNDSQFFIVKTDATWLNGQYTNFGIVTRGMDVVHKMEIGDKILSISTQ